MGAVFPSKFAYSMFRAGGYENVRLDEDVEATDFGKEFGEKCTTQNDGFDEDVQDEEDEHVLAADNDVTKQRVQRDRDARQKAGGKR
ncbi:hypothetical protein PsorP6_003758 [Peronosclerospora sorghi]|uniref:Uncharacterized protein n=1 Tax=Peronosclerospora sorghi TaxID=230839 RepID=A0ACC0VK88_9STRA|nr:hypothetical protein PsorP6_003758 [Peronosclerospora sorghi]